MKTLKITLLLLISTFTAQSQKQYVINSEYLIRPDTVWVFTPDNYPDEKAWSVTYMLHGWSGNYRHWDLLIDCQKYADKYKTIIVCPDGLYDSWYINSPVETENQYLDFFTEDLIPLIEKKYNIDNDHVYITGLSMGGHGALYLIENTPGYFTSAGSLSGLLDLRNWSDHYGLTRVLGLTDDKDDEDVLWYYSVVANVDTLKYNNKPIIVSCGTEDPFFNINTEFRDYCKSNNISIKFVQSSGAHDANYWRSAVVDHFEFFFGK